MEENLSKIGYNVTNFFSEVANKTEKNKVYIKSATLGIISFIFKLVSL